MTVIKVSLTKTYMHPPTSIFIKTISIGLMNEQTSFRFGVGSVEFRGFEDYREVHLLLRN